MQVIVEMSNRDVARARFFLCARFKKRSSTSTARLFQLAVIQTVADQAEKMLDELDREFEEAK